MEATGMAETNGAKAFGGIMAVGALAAFGWMLWQAQASNLDTLSQLTDKSITSLEDDIGEVQRLLEKHEDSEGHPQLSERVTSLENNGVSMRHQDRLIRLLWQRVYDEPMPEVNGGH